MPNSSDFAENVQGSVKKLVQEVFQNMNQFDFRVKDKRKTQTYKTSVLEPYNGNSRNSNLV
jgi:hypothetical protein